MGGAQRLPNGNTLICSSLEGTFIEIDATGEIVWRYVNPVTSTGPVAQGTIPGGGNVVFRAWRYAPGYAGLSGRDLTPGEYIER